MGVGYIYEALKQLSVFQVFSLSFFFFPVGLQCGTTDSGPV